MRSSPKHAQRKSKNLYATTIAASVLGISLIAVSLFVNGTTFANWIDTETTEAGEIQVGNLAITEVTSSTKVDVGRWAGSEHIVVATDVELSSVKTQPRTTLSYTAAFKVSMIGNLKAEVTCAVADSGSFSPINQSTGILDTLEKPVPVTELVIDNGARVETSPITVNDGDLLTARVTVTHPDKDSVYKNVSEEIVLPAVTCSIEQVLR